MKQTITLGSYKHPWHTERFWFYPDFLSHRNSRLIDLKITGLPFDDRQEIIRLMEAIGIRLMENMAEEKDGFVCYRAIGYSDEQIERQKQKARTRCRAVNKYMEKVGRPPLFFNPEDTYQSAWEYYELMRYQNDTVFGKTYLL